MQIRILLLILLLGPWSIPIQGLPESEVLVSNDIEGEFYPNQNLDQNYLDVPIDKPSAISASSPEYRDVAINSLTENFNIMTFDNIVSNTSIGSFYSGVVFSPGYTVLNSLYIPTFPPFSGGQVAISNEVNNSISFNNPVERFLARFSSDVNYYITVNGYDSQWNLVTSENILPNARNQEIKLFSLGKTISYIQISGPVGFQTHWVMDSVEIVYKNRNLINFDDLILGSSLPEYGLVEFPKYAELIDSPTARGSSGKIGVNFPSENLVTFFYPIHYIQFFVSTKPTTSLEIFFFRSNEKIGSLLIPEGSTSEFVTYNNTFDAFFVITGNSKLWVMDDIYFEIEKDIAPSYSIEAEIEGGDLDQSDPRVDTIFMEATVNFSNFIFDRIEVIFAIYSGMEENWTFVTRYSEFTWIAADGVFQTSRFQYTIESDNNYTVFYKVNFLNWSVKNQSNIFNSQAYGVPRFNLNTKKTDLLIFDSDEDGLVDSLSLDLNISYFNTINSTIVVYSTIIDRSAINQIQVLTQYNFPYEYNQSFVHGALKYITPERVFVNETFSERVNKNGTFFETFEFNNDMADYMSVSALFFVVVDGKELGKYIYDVNLFNRKIPDLFIDDRIEFLDKDGDGVFDSFTIIVNATYSRSEVTVLSYQVEVYSVTGEVSIQPEIAAILSFEERLNNSNQFVKSLPFQANVTGQYKLKFDVHLSVPSLYQSQEEIELDTPLSFWIDSVPIPLDGVGDDPQVPLVSNQAAVPFSLTYLFIAIVLISLRRRKK